MPLWGNSATNESKPKWLNTTRKERTFADSRGWVEKRPSGIDEVLVAIGGLGASLGAPTIASVRFNPTSVVQGSDIDFYVNYNEPVTISGIPTITVSGGLGTLTYNSADSNPAAGLLVFTMVTTTLTSPDTITVSGYTSLTISGASIIDATDGTTSGEVLLSNTVDVSASLTNAALAIVNTVAYTSSGVASPADVVLEVQYNQPVAVIPTSGTPWIFGSGYGTDFIYSSGISSPSTGLLKFTLDTTGGAGQVRVMPSGLIVTSGVGIATTISGATAVASLALNNTNVLIANIT
jgi:hypothetical protein